MLLAVLLAAAVAGLVPKPALEQSAAANSQPGPEHKRLEFLIGTWKREDVDKPSPAGPGGRVTGTTSCEWFNGRFHVICRSDFTGPAGSFKQLEIFSHNAEEGEYKLYLITSGGQVTLVGGKVMGKTWHWPSSSTEQGKLLRLEVQITEVSADLWTSRGELSVNGGAPVNILEGKASRIK